MVLGRKVTLLKILISIIHRESLSNLEYPKTTEKIDIALIGVAKRIEFTKSIYPAYLHADSLDETTDFEFIATSCRSVSDRRLNIFLCDSVEILNFH